MKRSQAVLGLLLALAGLCNGLYDTSSDVVSLTPENFDKKLNKAGVWLIELYAPWCGHCKNLKPAWEQAASALKGVVKVGAINADEHRSLGQRFGVQGFPTIKFAYTDASGELKTVDYNGGRSAQDLVRWALQQAEAVSLGRLGGKASAGGGGGGGGAGGAGSCGGGGRGRGSGDGASFYKGTGVVVLDDTTFHSQLSSSDDLVLVEFYAPWCGHCQALKPTWIDLAKSMEDKPGVKVAAVDCTVSEQTCQEFGVRGYPTIRFFGEDKERPEEYNGGRSLDDLIAFLHERWAKLQPPPEVRELTDQQEWEEHCMGHEADAALEIKAVRPKQLCLVAFLPHILDTKAEGRNRLIAILKGLAVTYKDRPFSYFWAEGGAQPGLEANFGVGGYGYPALIAYNPGKGKFATLKSAFEEKHVRHWMGDVRIGAESVAEISGQPAKVDSRAPWDGGDGEVAAVEEDEFSLEDLMKEEL